MKAPEIEKRVVCRSSVLHQVWCGLPRHTAAPPTLRLWGGNPLSLCIAPPRVWTCSALTTCRGKLVRSAVAVHMPFLRMPMTALMMVPRRLGMCWSPNFLA